MERSEASQKRFLDYKIGNICFIHTLFNFCREDIFKRKVNLLIKIDTFSFRETVVSNIATYNSLVKWQRKIKVDDGQIRDTIVLRPIILNLEGYFWVSVNLVALIYLVITQREPHSPYETFFEHLLMTGSSIIDRSKILMI